METSTVPLQDRAVETVMSRGLLTVAPDDSVLMAWELMRRGHFHHLPVVTDDGRLLGVLDAEMISSHWSSGGPDANRGPVSDLLHGHWRVTVAPGDRVSTAAKIMTRRRCDMVAVTEADGRLVGLLTARDLVAALAGDKPYEGQYSPNAPSLYRIEPVMPPRHLGQSVVGPD